MGIKYWDARKSTGDLGGNQKELELVGESSVKCQNSGGTPNMYMGQWDAVKEHMVWGIMEKNKELNIFNAGMGKATLKGADHVETTQPCNILSRKNFQKMRVECHSRTKMTMWLL
jgi:hypothetical protein